MMKNNIILASLAMAILLTIVSCSGNQSQNSENGQEAQVEEKKEITPQQLGETIADLYVEAMTQLSELVRDQPPAQEVKPEIEALKEEYVQQLVALGKQREALDESARSTVDLYISIGINAVYDQDAYTIYGDAVNDYFDERDVHALLTDFNILTQYANFDLLKQQEPEEAARLGIQ